MMHKVTRPVSPPQHSDAVGGLNDRFALAITRSVGTMWSAYLFTVLALLSLPAILVQGGFVATGVFPDWLVSVGLIALVAWVAQTFFQLVLLPVILVGQNLSARFADARAQATFDDVETLLSTLLMVADKAEMMQRTLTEVQGTLAQHRILLDVLSAPRKPARPRVQPPKP